MHWDWCGNDNRQINALGLWISDNSGSMHLVCPAWRCSGLARHGAIHDMSLICVLRRLCMEGVGVKCVPAGGHYIYISLLAPNRRDPNPNRPSAYDPQSLVCAVQLTNPNLCCG